MTRMTKTERRRQTREARSRRRTILFGVIATTVAGLAIFFLWRAFAPVPSVAADAKIQTTMEGFIPGVIHAKVGKPVTIQLINRDTSMHTDGGGWHQFAIDELGVNVKVGPESTQVVTFTPTRAGTFDFYCDVCCGGKENPSMHGKLEVSA